MKILQFNRPKGKREFGVWKEKLDAVKEYKGADYDPAELWLRVKDKMALREDAVKKRKQRYLIYNTAAAATLLIFFLPLLRFQNAEQSELIGKGDIKKIEPAAVINTSTQVQAEPGITVLANQASIKPRVQTNVQVITKTQDTTVKVQSPQEPAPVKVNVPVQPEVHEPVMLVSKPELFDMHHIDLKKIQSNSPMSRSVPGGRIIREGSEVQTKAPLPEDPADRILIH